jgi:hypothetical protein
MGRDSFRAGFFYKEHARQCKGSRISPLGSDHSDWLRCWCSYNLAVHSTAGRFWLRRQMVWQQQPSEVRFAAILGKGAVRAAQCRGIGSDHTPFDAGFTPTFRAGSRRWRLREEPRGERPHHRDQGPHAEARRRDEDDVGERLGDQPPDGGWRAVGRA